MSRKTYRHNESMKKKSIRKIVVLSAFLLAVALCLAVARSDKTVKAPGENTPQLKTESGQPIQGRYLLNGTIFWGRAVEKWSLKPDGTYDYNQPFSGLDSFQPDNYDAWVADMECPILDINIPYQVQVDNLQFNCRPEYLSQAAKYFDFLNLANNHSGDKGQDGFQTTKQNITNAGITPFGNFDPSISDDVCTVVSLPVRVLAEKKGAESLKLPVAFCAWHYFYRTPKPSEIDAMKNYAEIMPVFAFVHMGEEYLPTAADVQQNIARSVIDAGADFVIANNPHWVQNSEVYKNKLIFYSTGNFIFDQIDAETTRSASVDLTMDIPYDDNLQKWLELDCIAQETCLDEAKKQGLTELKPNYSFDIVAGQRVDHVTKKADQTTTQAIIERTNWHQTLKNLR